jgi:hypothetical protein
LDFNAARLRDAKGCGITSGRLEFMKPATQAATHPNIELLDPPEGALVKLDATSTAPRVVGH